MTMANNNTVDWLLLTIVNVCKLLIFIQVKLIKDEMIRSLRKEF